MDERLPRPSLRLAATPPAVTPSPLMQHSTVSPMGPESRLLISSQHMAAPNTVLLVLMGISVLAGFFLAPRGE